MRRSVLSAILAAALSVFACSEQPTEAPTAPPAVGGPSLLTSCTAAEIEAQIDALFPEGDLRTSAQAQFTSIPKKAGKKTGTAATDKAFAFVDFLLDTYYAGQLIGGKSSETFDQVLELISSLYCFLELASPTFPSTTEGTDVVVALVSPGDPTTTIVVPSEHAAVTIPEGATPEPTLIAISLLLDEPPPLRTSLDQYPFFYHFSGTTATGPVTFNLDVTAGVCLRDIIDVPDQNLRLAHNVEPFDFGDVEILPRPTEVPGLDCSDLGFGEGLRRIGATGAQGQGRFAWARKLFLPAELHAASLALATTGVGGTTKKFSEFGVVDIFSNPGSFEPVGPTSTTETGGSTVTRTVLVTSQNETPIPNVPVTFATDDGTLDGEESELIVFTGEDGIASVSWTLPSEPGIYTLSAEVPEEDNAPFETNEPPSTNIASTPDVDFDPASLTFTAAVLAEPPFGFENGEAEWTADGFWNRNTLSELSNAAYPQFVTTFDAGEGDEPGGTLPTPFAGSFAAWYGQPSTGNYIGTQTADDADLSGGTSAEPNSGAFLSPPFRVPDILGAEASFQTWWEIEGINPSTFDLMEVVVLDALGTELGVVRLNPQSDPTDPVNRAPLAYTSGGFNTAPVWEQVVVDLSEHRGRIVRLRFDFDTGDENYNGFRGWIIDQVQVATFEGPSLMLGAGPQQSRKLVPADRATFPPGRERP